MIPNKNSKIKELTRYYLCVMFFSSVSHFVWCLWDLSTLISSCFCTYSRMLIFTSLYPMPLALFCAHFSLLSILRYTIFIFIHICLTKEVLTLNCDNTPTFIELSKKRNQLRVTLCYWTHSIIPATNINLGLFVQNNVKHSG